MMRTALSHRDRRALLVGMALVTMLLVTGRGLPALGRVQFEWMMRADRAALTLQRAASLRREIGLRNATPRHADEALRASAHSGVTPVAAAARALGYVTGLTEVFGGAVIAARPDGDEQFQDGATVIVLHLQVHLDAEGLHMLLAELEAGPKLFLVRSIAVTQSSPLAPSDEPERLTVELALETPAVSGEESAP